MKKRQTYTYTYRSIYGIDIRNCCEIDSKIGRRTMVEQTRSDFVNSFTPLVELDGKKIDITDFLLARKEELDCELDRLHSNRKRLYKEIERRRAQNAMNTTETQSCRSMHPVCSAICPRCNYQKADEVAAKRKWRCGQCGYTWRLDKHGRERRY